MRKTSNLDLRLYDASDKFDITNTSDSLNNNMEIIDEHVGNLNNDIKGIDELKKETASLKEDIGNINFEKTFSDGFIDSSGSQYPTVNASFPNSKYCIVELKKGETLVVSGLVASYTTGRTRVIHDGEIIGNLENGSEFYTTSKTASSSIENCTIKAIDDVSIGFVDLRNERPDTLRISYGFDTVSNWLRDCTSKINKNADSIYENHNDIETLLNASYFVDTDRDYNLFPSDCITTPDSTIDFFTGDVLKGNIGYFASDYIEIDSTKEYLCTSIYVYRKTFNPDRTYTTENIQIFDKTKCAFYNDKHEYVRTASDRSDNIKRIPSTAKYVRVTIMNKLALKYARLIYGTSGMNGTVYIRDVSYKKTPALKYVYPNTGYEGFSMVMFGDSITHGDVSVNDEPNGISYINYTNDYLNSNIINVGFGGTRMSEAGATGGTVYFSFNRLCDSIISGDWSNQDAYALENNTYANHLDTLKSIDWMSINAIGLMYGANDYASSTAIGTDFSTDINKFDGACAYGLDKLLSAYPHLQVIIIKPFYRQMEFGDETTGADIKQNTRGLTIKDYGDSLENVRKIIHCPLVDAYQELGINKYNIMYWTADGTHPRTEQAQKRYGHLFANIIKRYLSPV